MQEVVLGVSMLSSLNRPSLQYFNLCGILFFIFLEKV